MIKNVSTEEERAAIIDKMDDPVFCRDLYFVEDGEVIEVYINFDSTMPCIEFNHFSFDNVLDSYKEANGNLGRFFDLLYCDYVQYYNYIVDDESIELARECMSAKADFVNLNKEKMDALVSAVKERMNA